jgi:hypothetical protein
MEMMVMMIIRRRVPTGQTMQMGASARRKKKAKKIAKNTRFVCLSRRSFSIPPTVRVTLRAMQNASALLKQSASHREESENAPSNVGKSL